MIQGCLKWQKHGLGTSECVLAATQAYRDEENHVLAFVEEECNRNGEVTKGELYHAYQMWADTQRIKHPLNMKAFGNEIKRLLHKELAARREYGSQFEGQRWANGRNNKVWLGISLADADSFKK
jgi:phage/plasmid-associated DNA primase